MDQKGKDHDEHNNHSSPLPSFLLPPSSSSYLVSLSPPISPPNPAPCVVVMFDVDIQSFSFSVSNRLPFSYYLSLTYNQNSKILLDFLLGSDDTSLTCTHALTCLHRNKKASWEVSPVSLRDKREIHFIPVLYKVAHFGA